MSSKEDFKDVLCFMWWRIRIQPLFCSIVFDAAALLFFSVLLLIIWVSQTTRNPNSGAKGQNTTTFHKNYFTKHNSIMGNVLPEMLLWSMECWVLWNVSCLVKYCWNVVNIFAKHFCNLPDMRINNILSSCYYDTKLFRLHCVSLEMYLLLQISSVLIHY